MIQIGSIVSIAAFVGVMISVYTSHYSLWIQKSPQDFLQWYQITSKGITDATGPTGIASLFLPLITLIVTWRNKQCRIYWFLAFTLVGSIIVITMVYFARVNMTFGNQSISLEDISGTLETWGSLHILRIILGVISAFLAGIGLVKFNSAD